MWVEHWQSHFMLPPLLCRCISWCQDREKRGCRVFWVHSLRNQGYYLFPWLPWAWGWIYTCWFCRLELFYNFNCHRAGSLGSYWFSWLDCCLKRPPYHTVYESVYRISHRACIASLLSLYYRVRLIRSYDTTWYSVDAVLTGWVLSCIALQHAFLSSSSAVRQRFL